MSETPTEHVIEGVGSDIRAYCPACSRWFGPHLGADGAMPFCPYCGEDAGNTKHERLPAFGEVSCENTGQSTYRYCPGCGEGIER